ncbi:MAG: RHS repeat-associated core domain-containing protein [Myxococcota bacterium]
MLDDEAFTVATRYDALDRVTSLVSPDGSDTTRTYDEGGRLVTVAVAVKGAAGTSFVDHIAYDARGQRLSIAYGNGTSTTYAYDPYRFWLTRLHTLRGATALQDLQYTHDAVGNIVEIRDDAQQTEFFANAAVTPTRTFAYDALYRLVRATGREKVDQRQTTAFYADYAGATGAIPDPADPALRQYTQAYRYDAVGNLLEMKHQQGLGGAVAWRRGYAYEPGNNQLVSTSAPGDDPDDPATHTDRYPYNERGAMTAMPHLPAVVRDPQDQIRRADLDLAGSVAWYAYDAAGQRVRKRVDKGGVQEERSYVGGYEVWRKRTASGLQEERQTLHVTDDDRRIALIETLTVTNGSAVVTPTPRQRYQLGDHLGTAALELDEVGAIIGYEEYHPYGTTSWWASDGSTDVSAKRFRYTGMERDDETGLAYHGARYLAPWLGRWTAADPIGLADGVNRFAYVRGNPVGRSDPTGLLEGLERFLAATATLSGSAAAGALADDVTGIGVLDDFTLLVSVPIFAVSAGILGGIYLAGGFQDLAAPPRPEADLLRERRSPILAGDEPRTAPVQPPAQAPQWRSDEHGNVWTHENGTWTMTSHAKGAPGALGETRTTFSEDQMGGRLAGGVPLALGLGMFSDLKWFAERMGFRTYMSFYDDTFDKIELQRRLTTLMHGAEAIHFNLTGLRGPSGEFLVDERTLQVNVGVLADIAREGRTGGLSASNLTNWEFSQVLEDPELLSKTTFYFQKTVDDESVYEPISRGRLP